MIAGLKMEEIRDALLDAFSADSLRQMLRLRLNRRLDVIVASGPLKDVAFELLSVADQEGWDVDLVREAYRFNPGNARLLEV